MKMTILLLLLINTTFAAYIPIKGKIPSELHHIITTLQTSSLYSAHKEEINSIIPRMDQALSSLDSDDIHLIIKSEIFKTLLQFPPSAKRSFESLSPKMIEDIHAVSKKVKSPFLSWLSLAVRADLKQLLHSPLFPSFKKAIKSPHAKWSRPMILMKKKFSLLLPWHDYLTTTSEGQLSEKLYPLLLKCLRQIHFKSARYASLIPSHSPAQDKLQYFEKILPATQKNPLDSLINPVIERNKKADLPLPVDGWVPKKKDDYTQKLPEPTDDWLPEPVDDWKL